MNTKICEKCKSVYIVQRTKKGTEFGECICGEKYKKCPTCNKWLKVNGENFRKQKKGKFGYRSSCNQCLNEYDLQWRQKNIDHIKLYHIDIRDRKKQYFEKNKERILEYRKNWSSSERGKCLAFNRHNRRRTKLKEQGRGITEEQWLDMMNFFNWECAYSSIVLNKNTRTIDHIIPINTGGLNEIWNCVPMFKNYNSSKKTSEPMEWYMSQEFYSKDRLNKIIEWQIYSFSKYGTKDDKLILINKLKV